MSWNHGHDLSSGFFIFSLAVFVICCLCHVCCKSLQKKNRQPVTSVQPARNSLSSERTPLAPGYPPGAHVHTTRQPPLMYHPAGTIAWSPTVYLQQPQQSPQTHPANISPSSTTNITLPYGLRDAERKSPNYGLKIMPLTSGVPQSSVPYPVEASRMQLYNPSGISHVSAPYPLEQQGTPYQSEGSRKSAPHALDASSHQPLGGSQSSAPGFVEGTQNKQLPYPPYGYCSEKNSGEVPPMPLIYPPNQELEAAGECEIDNEATDKFGVQKDWNAETRPCPPGFKEDCLPSAEDSVKKPPPPGFIVGSIARGPTVSVVGTLGAEGPSGLNEGPRGLSEGPSALWRVQDLR